MNQSIRAISITSEKLKETERERGTCVAAQSNDPSMQMATEPTEKSLKNPFTSVVSFTFRYLSTLAVMSAMAKTYANLESDGGYLRKHAYFIKQPLLFLFFWENGVCATCAHLR